MSSFRLLILDDDAMVGLTIQLIAEAAGGQVRLTADAHEFFDITGQGWPTHLCVDLNMPGMDGLQVLGELARRGCRAQVIVSSGIGQKVLEAASRSAAEQGLRVAGTLAKPFAPATLRALLRRAAGPEPARPGPAAAAPAPFVPDREALAEALRRHELTVVYQPKLRCRTGQLAGVEALVRWMHPLHGRINPDAFITLAESSGLIDELTQQVLEQALAWFVPWREAETGRGELTLSINVSARSLVNADLIDRLTASCTRAGMHAGQLIFELTETAAMEDATLALELLTRLRLRGFQLSIDDFGTGYSSMVQLVRLPFSEIKVDRSFVMTAADSAESRAVIRSITDLGHSLGLRVVAEGVEDDEALAYLREAGCDEVQGFLFARPMAAEQLELWCRDRQPDGGVQRLQVLRALHLLDTPREPRFDRLTALARRAFGADVALICLAEESRMWVKSAEGIELQEMPLEGTMCGEAIRDFSLFVVPDLSLHPRFADHPLVHGSPHLRFYGGCPLRAGTGPALGTLAVLDRRSRPFSQRERALLRGLADLVELELCADRQTLIDATTGLLRHDPFVQRAHDALAWAQHAGLPCSLLLIDLAPREPAQCEHHDPTAIDHQAGAWAPLLAAAAGRAGLVGRYGRTQLVALLVGTDASQADALTAGLRGRALERAGAMPPRDPCTVGVGHAGTEEGGPATLQVLLTRADAMLEAWLHPPGCGAAADTAPTPATPLHVAVSAGAR